MAESTLPIPSNLRVVYDGSGDLIGFQPPSSQEVQYLAGGRLSASQVTTVQALVSAPWKTRQLTEFGSMPYSVATGRYDCTQALLNAMSELRAIAQDSSLSLRATNRFGLVLPAGTFVVDSGQQFEVDFAGFYFSGAGRNRSVILRSGNSGQTAGAAVMFRCGEFTAAPSQMFPSPGLDPVFEDIGFFGTDNLTSNPPSTGNQNRGTFLQCNGHGFVLRRVKAQAWGYGVANTYGGDFATIDECEFYYNGTHAYHGIGCQQVLHHNSIFGFGADKGIVLDRVKHFNSTGGCTYQGSRTANIVFESTSNTTSRFITTFPSDSGPTHQLSAQFQNPFIEGFSSSSVEWTPTHHVMFDNNGTDAIRGVTFNGAYFVSGSHGGKTTTSLIGSIGAVPPQLCRLNYAVFRGSATNIGFGISDLKIRDFRTETGSTTPTISNVTPTTYSENDQEFRRGSFPITQQFSNYAADTGVRLNYAASGVVKYELLSGGSYFDRLNFDVTNRRVHFGDLTEPYISRAAAIPSTSAPRGSIVLNTVAASGQPAFWINTSGSTTWAAGPNVP